MCPSRQRGASSDGLSVYYSNERVDGMVLVGDEELGSLCVGVALGFSLGHKAAR